MVERVLFQEVGKCGANINIVEPEINEKGFATDREQGGAILPRSTSSKYGREFPMVG